MTTAEVTKPGRGGARGPRTFKESPTSRDRVIGESLAKKVKELTNRDLSVIDVLAVKFSISRWYEDPATKELMNNIEPQLKRAEAQKKKEKAEALLREAEAELGETESDEDSDDADDDATAAAAADGEDEDDDEGTDVFDEEDGKVSASF